MTTIQEAVAEKLKSQKGGKGDLALWDDLWTTFQKSGAEGVEALLERLVAPPDDDDEGRQHPEEET